MSLLPSSLPEIPVLETARLLLRGHQSTDLQSFVEMWSEPAFYRFITPGPATEEDVWSKVLRNIGHWALLGFGNWVVEEKATGRFIGSVGFMDYKRTISPPLGAIEIGWGIVAGAHGKGYATEAVGAALAWGTAHFPSPQTVCIIHPDNTASLRLAERFGFQKVTQTTYHGAPIIVFARNDGR